VKQCWCWCWCWGWNWNWLWKVGTAKGVWFF